MRQSMQSFFLGAIAIGITLNLQAQSVFEEGMLLYEVDTLERLVPNPGKYSIVQMKVYKKGKLARQEIISVNGANRSDTLRSTQIRNALGIYICLETNSTPEKIAVLTTYEEEQFDKMNRAKKGHLPTYTIEKKGQKSELLGMNAERVLLKSATDTKPLEAWITTVIEVPVGLFFESLSQVKGTPLQFSEREGDWLIRYTATTIENRGLPEQLFEVDPKFMVVTMKQMQEMGSINK